MKTPNVLMIGPSLESRGGMVTVEKQLMKRLSHATFLPTYKDCNKVKKAFVALGAYVKFCFELKKTDIVHAHMASRGSYERKAIFLRRAMKAGKKTVIHLHGGEFCVWFDDEMDNKKRDEVRALFEAVDAVILLSEEWKKWICERGFNVERLVVIHNAVPVPIEPCSPCAHQGILFLGRLDENKSPDVLLHASKKMLEENPDAKLLFGGDGYLERYRALAEELGIAERCEFLGWISGNEKEKLFERAGVYCLPSKHEGMPMSVLEAMAHGIPTVVTPVGGVPQIIEDGVNGMLVPVDDAERLSDVLCKLLDSPGLRESIGVAGRKTIESKFNIEQNITELTQLYEELMV